MVRKWSPGRILSILLLVVAAAVSVLPFYWMVVGTSLNPNDVIKGVLFYLAMLMPFAFFAERLLIASSDIKWQIVGFFGIFNGNLL